MCYSEHHPHGSGAVVPDRACLVEQTDMKPPTDRSSGKHCRRISICNGSCDGGSFRTLHVLWARQRTWSQKVPSGLRDRCCAVPAKRSVARSRSGDFVNAETWWILLELYILFDRDRRPRCAGFGMCCNFSRLSTDESFLSLGEIRKSSPVKVRGMSSMMRRIREGTAEASRPH
jgi:hypothetical protein